MDALYRSTITPVHTKSWRDIIPEHKAASLFPMMAPEELKALATDVKIRGLVSPIAITAHMRSDGTWKYQLVDGRNRLEAMKLAGIEFTLVLEDGKCKIKSDMDYVKEGGFYPEAIVVPEEEALAYVISVNMRRRHLTCEQRRDVIAKLIDAQPTRSDRQIAEQIKASPSTVGKVRKEREDAGAVSILDRRIDRKGRKQPAHKPVAEKHRTVDSFLDNIIECPTPVDINKSTFAPADITEPTSVVTDSIAPTDTAEESEADARELVRQLEYFKSEWLSRVKAWNETHPGAGYGTTLYAILDEIHCETGTLTLEMMRGRTVKEGVDQ